MELDYASEVMRLEEEWPQEKLRALVVGTMRDMCQFALKKREQLEIENKEMRARGISYAERKICSAKIDMADKLFNKWRDMGIKYSKGQLEVYDFVQPDDMEYIHTMGFEQHIKSALLW